MGGEETSNGGSARGRDPVNKICGYLPILEAIEHELRASQERLGDDARGIGLGEAVVYAGLGHRIDHAEDPCRGGRSDRCKNREVLLIEHDRLADRIEELACCSKLLVCCPHGAQGTHRLADLRIDIGHDADQGNSSPEIRVNLIDCATCSNRNDAEFLGAKNALADLANDL